MATTATGRVEIEGLPRLRRTAAAAAKEIDDMAPAHQAAAAAIISAARPPVLTGALARSSVATTPTADGVTVTSPLSYAAPVHWGRKRGRGAPVRARPYFIEAMHARDAQITRTYLDHVQDAVSKIKGA